MQQANNQFDIKPIFIGGAISFLMLLTRGSHVLTSVSLPDASLALLLIGGLYLRKAAWFALFVALATVIDFGASAMDSWYGFCLTAGYWGMFPTYAVMWLAGLWLSKQSNRFDILKFSASGLIATFVAFLISTQTYYLFSGRFPSSGMIESLQHGWEYLPSYMGFTAMYLAAFWILTQIFSRFIKPIQISSNKSA